MLLPFPEVCVGLSSTFSAALIEETFTEVEVEVGREGVGGGWRWGEDGGEENKELFCWGGG